MTISGPVATLLEMAAMNNGFDREHREDGWLAYTSTQVPLRVRLRPDGDADYIVALSHFNVARALSDYGERISIPLPNGAVAARLVLSMPALHQLLRRSFQLSRTLPDELLHSFQRATAGFPRATEVERLVIARVGQDLFRAGLVEYWEGRCAITGLQLATLLRASHIKPWATCETDAERLDVFNGVLLSPNLDAAFDRGLISFRDDGTILIADAVSEADRTALGLTSTLQFRATEGHRPFLSWHRANRFRLGSAL